MRYAWVLAVDAAMCSVLGLALCVIGALTEEFDARSIDIP